MLRSVLNSVFSVKCFSCGRDASGVHRLVCDPCAADALARSAVEKSCRVCGREIHAGGKDTCYRCSVTSYRFRKNVSILDYRQPVVRELTHRFKFGSNRQAGKDLAGLLKTRLRSEAAECGCEVTTVAPLSQVSLRKRGFNQVERILDWCGIPYLSLLKRSGHFRHQSELNSMDRSVLIKGQFRMTQKGINSIQGKKIMLVDDVFTTGSTANEISGVLLDAGALSVDVLTFFRD